MTPTETRAFKLYYARVLLTAALTARGKADARAYADEHYDEGSISWCAAYDAYCAALAALTAPEFRRGGSAGL